MITQENFIKEYNFIKYIDYYQENGWLYILDFNIYGIGVSLIKELPSKIKFTENCDVNII